MQSFDEIVSPDPELGLEDDVLLSNTTMFSSSSSSSTSPARYPVPKWMRPAQTSVPASLAALRQRASRFVVRSVWPLLQRLGLFVRPCLTVRYILLASLVTYTLYRYLTSQPLLSSRLPAYTGPYDVGAVDLEMPLPHPQRVNDVVSRQDGTPAFEVETVLFTLYYPTARKNNARQREKLYWIPSPVSATAKGYARFIGMDNVVVTSFLTAALWLVSPWGIPIPARVGAPVLPPQDALESGADPLPVLVFTHGMLSSRTDYTSYLGELASRGVVVAALEHRDGSSPGSAIRKHGQPDKWRYWFGLSDLDLTTQTAFDTAAFKETQLAFREAEIDAAVSILRDLNTGAGPRIAAQNPRHPTTPGRDETFLTGFQNRLNTTHFLLGGHSYGGTGALRTASTLAPLFQGVVALDPGKSSGPLNANISIPLLILHSTSWSAKHSLFFGRPHFDVVRDIAEGVNLRCDTPSSSSSSSSTTTHTKREEAAISPRETTCSNGAKAWFLTSLGTSHPSITDAPLLEPLLLSWTTGSIVAPQQGIHQYVDLSRDFVRYCLDRNQRNGLLELTGDEVTRTYDAKHNDKMPVEWRKYWQMHVAPD